MADIQSATVEIRRGKKDRKKKKKPQAKNIIDCPIPWGSHDRMDTASNNLGFIPRSYLQTVQQYFPQLLQY